MEMRIDHDGLGGGVEGVGLRPLLEHADDDGKGLPTGKVDA
ncbi:hypothetical protein [Nocardioides mangrovicus]|nr:hypothetical protein [Nocardioides mangrovicus]